MPKTGTSPRPPAAEPGATAPGELTRKTGRAPRGPSPHKTGQTRQALLNAALAEFMEHGYARATTASIAQRAGMAKITLYRYFHSKEEILERVIAERVANAANLMESAQIQPGERVGDFLLRVLLPSFQILDSAGRAATARLVVVEGLEFPNLAQLYREKAHYPLVEQIRSLATLALQRGELPNDTLVRHPELLLGPLWLAMMNNTVLHPAAPLNGAVLFQALVEELFHLRAPLPQAAPMCMPQALPPAAA